jgi:hypothetical protein
MYEFLSAIMSGLGRYHTRIRVGRQPPSPAGDSEQLNETSMIRHAGAHALQPKASHPAEAKALDAGVRRHDCAGVKLGLLIYIDNMSLDGRRGRP